MARVKLEGVVKDSTTVVVSKTLLDRLGVHVRKNSDTQSDFMTRAILNQLEREGDVEIRTILKEEESNSLGG